MNNFESKSRKLKKKFNIVPWTSKQHSQFLNGLRTHGRHWSGVASSVDGKTEQQCKTRAQRYFAQCYFKGVPLPDKVLESGKGHTLSGKPLDPQSATALSVQGKYVSPKKKRLRAQRQGIVLSTKSKRKTRNRRMEKKISDHIRMQKFFKQKRSRKQKSVNNDYNKLCFDYVGEENIQDWKSNNNTNKKAIRDLDYLINNFNINETNKDEETILCPTLPDPNDYINWKTKHQSVFANRHAHKYIRQPRKSKRLWGVSYVIQSESENLPHIIIRPMHLKLFTEYKFNNFLLWLDLVWTRDVSQFSSREFKDLLIRYNTQFYHCERSNYQDTHLHTCKPGYKKRKLNNGEYQNNNKDELVEDETDARDSFYPSIVYEPDIRHFDCDSDSDSNCFYELNQMSDRNHHFNTLPPQNHLRKYRRFYVARISLTDKKRRTGKPTYCINMILKDYLCNQLSNFNKKANHDDGNYNNDFINEIEIEDLDDEKQEISARQHLFDDNASEFYCYNNLLQVFDLMQSLSFEKKDSLIFIHFKYKPEIGIQTFPFANNCEENKYKIMNEADIILGMRLINASIPMKKRRVTVRRAKTYVPTKTIKKRITFSPPLIEIKDDENKDSESEEISKPESSPHMNMRNQEHVMTPHNDCSSLPTISVQLNSCHIDFSATHFEKFSQSFKAVMNKNACITDVSADKLVSPSLPLPTPSNYSNISVASLNQNKFEHILFSRVASNTNTTLLAEQSQNPKSETDCIKMEPHKNSRITIEPTFSLNSENNREASPAERTFNKFMRDHKNPTTKQKRPPILYTTNELRMHSRQRRPRNRTNVRLELYLKEKLFKSLSPTQQNSLNTVIEIFGEQFLKYFEHPDRKKKHPWVYLISTRDSYHCESIPIRTKIKKHGRTFTKTDWYVQNCGIPPKYASYLKDAEHQRIRNIKKIKYSKMARIQEIPTELPINSDSDQEVAQPQPILTTEDLSVVHQNGQIHKLLEADTEQKNSVTNTTSNNQTQNFFECCPVHHRSIVDPHYGRLYWLGVSTYENVFAESELFEIEDATDQIQNTQKACEQTAQHTARGHILQRTKNFFGARYLWKAEDMKNSKKAAIAAGIRVDVDGLQPAYDKLCVKKLTQLGILPAPIPMYGEGNNNKREVIGKMDYINQHAMNMYHTGNEGIGPHYDDVERFCRPIITVRLFSEARLSFGDVLFGTCGGMFTVPLHRGCVLKMHRNTFAADGIKHSVRRQDMYRKSAALIFRRIRSYNLKMAKKYLLHQQKKLRREKKKRKKQKRKRKKMEKKQGEREMERKRKSLAKKQEVSETEPETGQSIINLISE